MCSLAKVIIEEVGCKVTLQLRNWRTVQPSHAALKCCGIALSRNYSQSKEIKVQENQNKEPENDEKTNELSKTGSDLYKYQKDLTPLLPENKAYPSLIYWDEKYRIKRAKKDFKEQNKIKGFSDYFVKSYNLNSYPRNFTQLTFFLKTMLLKRQIIDQRYLIQRVGILKPDLAAAHFIIYRGGSVKFVDKEWMGPKEATKLLPTMYIPTYLVEGINAEGTHLIKEGLANLVNLRYMKWLSLKGLESVNDWFMDWVSNEYHETLEHLDISYCKKVTHRALSCFYRFEKLKTFKVEGVSDTPEFKVACLMLLDIFPHLEIIGINLEIPQKIESIDENETKEIKEESTKYLQKQSNVS